MISFKKSAAGLALVAALGMPGCSTIQSVLTPTSAAAPAPAVTLAQVQQEAQAILIGLQAGAQVYATSPTANKAVVQDVSMALATAQGAVAALTSATSAPAPQILATEAAQAINGVVAVLPLDPNTKTAIDLGVAVVDAFVAALPPPVVTPPPATTTGPVVARQMPALVPIPIPTKAPGVL